MTTAPGSPTDATPASTSTAAPTPAPTSASATTSALAPSTTPTDARPSRLRLTASDAARIATFAALIAVLGLPGQLGLFGNAVPVTLQTLGVMLAGAILGPWRGAAAAAVLLLLVAAGLPLLAGGRGGLGVFAGPSAGYALGFVLGAAVVGLIVHRGGPRPGRTRVMVACLVGGIGAIYAVGIPVQAAVMGLGLGPTALGSLVFLPGDLLKAVVATVVTLGVFRAYPDAVPGRHRAATRIDGAGRA